MCQYTYIGEYRCMGRRKVQPHLLLCVVTRVYSSDQLLSSWFFQGRLLYMHLANVPRSWNCIPENVTKISLLVKAAQCSLRTVLFVCLFKIRCRVETPAQLLGCRPLPAQATGPFDCTSSCFFCLFFFSFLLPQVPSSVQYLCRLLCRRR